MALAAGTRLGPYEIQSLIGAGGMGEVYRASDSRLGRDVAIKVLPDAFAGDGDRLRRFAQEARSVAALNHPNILTVHDVGTHGATPFVVTELLDGETWRDLLVRRAPTARQVLTYALQAAHGLAAAHASHFVHRDLKPENLFLTTDGRVKILDFGLAKQIAPVRDADGTRTTGMTGPAVLMGTLAYMAPEQLLGRPVDVRTDVFAFGVVLYEMLAGAHPFQRDTVAATLSAILHDVPPALAGRAGTPPLVDGVVRRCLAKNPDERFADAHELALALEEALGTRTSAVAPQDVEERSPYPGLRAFTHQDAALFFGREEEVAALWARIRARPLLGVIGPSGAGKSSFVRAGLLPARPEGWAAVVCTPGPAPLRSLGQALAPDLASDVEALRQLVSFDDPAVVFRVLRRWRDAHDAALLVFDQFEELFTLNGRSVQDDVAHLVGRLITETDVRVVLAIRDDFLIRCQDLRPLASVFADLTPLGTLTPASLRRAVVEPARKRGYQFEDDALVEEIVCAVEGARAALPLLAFAVARLWDLRDPQRKLLTRAAYEKIGGVAGALAEHAEATLDRIGSMRHDIVRELFRNLVTGQGTRAVMDREELLSAFPDRRAAETVLGELVDARLLTSAEAQGSPGEPVRHVVEIVHESLLKAWPRLVRWQAQDEDGARLRDQLKIAAHLWAEKDRSADLLWTGTAYQEFVIWRQRYQGALTALEEHFARAMADRADRKRRLRRAALAAAFVALTAIALAIGMSRQQAVASAHRAEASKLLALAQLRFADDPTEAVALIAASLEQADSREARAFLMKALWEAPLALEAVGGANLGLPAFSPDGKWLATGGLSSEVRVWPDNGGAPIVLAGHQPNERGGIWASWAANDLLVTGWARVASKVYLWSIPDGKRLRTIELPESSEWHVAPRRLLSESAAPGGASQAILRSWALPAGEAVELGTADWHALNAAASVYAPDGRSWIYLTRRQVYARPLLPDVGPDRLLAEFASDIDSFSRDPERLLVRAKGGEMRVWRYGASGDPDVLTLRSEAVPAAAPRLDRSGRWLYGRAEGQVQITPSTAWPGARPIGLRRAGSWYLSGQDFHPSGDWVVATTSNASRLTFWPLKRQQLPTIVDGDMATQRLLTFSPDGRWLASAWGDGTVRLWPMPGGGERDLRILRPPAGGLWFPLEFDASGHVLLVGEIARRNRPVLVPVDGSAPRGLQEISPQTDTRIGAAALSPSGRRVAAASAFGPGQKTLHVWDLLSGVVKRFVLPPAPAHPSSSADDIYERGVVSMAFADDTILYTVGDGGLRRWNVETGAHEVVAAVPAGRMLYGWFARDARVALTIESVLGRQRGDCRVPTIRDTRGGTSRPLRWFGECLASAAIDSSGEIAAIANLDGTARVGRLDRDVAHVLVGHKGSLDRLAISPDRRWIATSGEDNTLRLWPMPDLSTVSLHELPRDQLLAKLRTLTNLRAVQDPASSTAWRMEAAAYAGWRHVPSW